MVNHEVVHRTVFDTLKIRPVGGVEEVRRRAKEHKINFRYFEDGKSVCFVWISSCFFSVFWLIPVFFLVVDWNFVEREC